MKAEESQVSCAPSGHNDQKTLIWRVFCFAIGIAVNAFGVACITRAGLGTSPISSLPYVLSHFPNWGFGTCTFVMNLGFILLQILLLRRQFQSIQLLQLVVNVLFSFLIDGFMFGLQFWTPQTVGEQFVGVIVGCIILAFGICLEVAPALVYVPGEGVVRALSTCLSVELGRVKLLFDVTLVLLAATISYFCHGAILGLGWGTVASALLIGTFVAAIRKHLGWIQKIEALSRASILD